MIRKFPSKRFIRLAACLAAACAVWGCARSGEELQGRPMADLVQEGWTA